MNKPTYEDLEAIAKISIGLYTDAVRRTPPGDPGAMAYYLVMEDIAERVGRDDLDAWIESIDIRAFVDACIRRKNEKPS